MRGNRKYYAATVTGTGAFLDISTGMRPVALKLDDVSQGDPRKPLADGAGIFAPAMGKYPLRVLVVDDERLIRWAVAESLSELGMDVEQVGDAASALHAVTTPGNSFQVVVMDLRLPDMSDLSLLATLRQLLPDARLILMTAFGTPDIATEAALLGAAVINKPFELHELSRLVVDGRRPV
jgi:CheY-like chemotaxis protein